MPAGNRVLLIDDDLATASYLKEKLSAGGGYSVSLESKSQRGPAALKENPFDIVIIRFGMADLDSSELIKGLKKIDPDCVIVVLVEASGSTILKDAGRLGIYDFVVKPINLDKLFFLLKKGIELHSSMIAYRKFSQSVQEQNVSLQRQNIVLARRIEESTKNLSRLYEDLRTTYMRTIKALAQAIDARDHYTHSHSENVAKYAVAIAEEMHLPARDIEMIRDACELHDLGKIGVQDKILSKPSSLTDEEWLEIRRHPVMGAQILEPLTFLNVVIDLVRQHHERYDGSGYPEGRRGEDILLGARIINLADAYETMRSSRSYRKVPFSKEDAVAEVKKNIGTQFDPKVVEAFLKIVDNL